MVCQLLITVGDSLVELEGGAQDVTEFLAKSSIVVWPHMLFAESDKSQLMRPLLL